MMLNDYNVHAMLLAEGSGHVQVPSSHPALAELERGRVKPVGAVRDMSPVGAARGKDWIYLYRLRDWNRLAADQFNQSQRAQPARAPSYRERPLQQPLHT